MMFSQSDIDVLRLICWCQYVKPGSLSGLSTPVEQGNLLSLGLIQFHEKSEAFTLTRKGRSFLHEVLTLPDLTKSYHKDAIERRLRLTKLAITAYRGNVNIFVTAPEELSNSPVLFLSAITRSRGTNPWGSTRVAAIAHLGDLFCAVHYVSPGIGKIALTDELNAFTNQTAQFRGAKRAFLFAGDSYGSILTELEALPPQTDAKLVSYGDAYRCLQLPVHLLPCDKTGAVQLQIMAAPDYRTRLAKAALNEMFQPPPPDAPAWDALFQNMPFVIAADMDLRRLDAAIETAHERGMRQIAIGALKKQATEVLISRYQNTGLAKIFALTNETVSAVTGRPPVPYVPPRTQFLTEKGEVVDAPPIRIPGKAGG